MFMLLVRHFVSFIIKILLLITVPFAAVFIAISTKPDVHDKVRYRWGGIYGTYDNPPQGDEGYVTKRCLFPNQITGFKGYINRVLWMIRNPLYNLARYLGIEWDASYTITQEGNPDISDKYKIPGKLMTKAWDKNGKLVAFGFYMVKPWSKTRNLRIRWGWKVKSRAVEEQGFIQFVATCNPFDGYGND